MSAILAETIQSISRTANTLIESDTVLCLSCDPDDVGTVRQGIERGCRELRSAAAELTPLLATQPNLAPLHDLSGRLNDGVEYLSTGMRILARYWQMSQVEIERAADLVNTGYAAIDNVLRTLVNGAGVAVDLFSPRRSRMHAQRARLLASLAERFTERRRQAVQTA